MTPAIFAMAWMAYIGDYTDPVHHNHISDQAWGWYSTKADCEADMEHLRRSIIGGVVIPSGVIVCVQRN